MTAPTQGIISPTDLFPHQSRWVQIALTDYLHLIRPDKKSRPGNWKEQLETQWQAALYGGFLENRSPLFDIRHNPVATIHVGTDYWMDAGTPVFFPLEGIVRLSRPMRSQQGGWGGRLDIQTAFGIYILGHLETPSFVVGDCITPNQEVGVLAPRERNGGWLPHLHLQRMSPDAYNRFTDPNEIDAYSTPYPTLTSDYLNP